MKILKAVGARILVQRLAPEQLSSTIVIPDMVDQRSQKFKVLLVGSGRVDERTGNRIPPSVQPGDVVLLSKYAGEEVMFDGRPAMFVDESEILATVG